MHLLYSKPPISANDRFSSSEGFSPSHPTVFPQSRHAYLVNNRRTFSSLSVLHAVKRRVTVFYDFPISLSGFCCLSRRPKTRSRDTRAFFTSLGSRERVFGKRVSRPKLSDEETISQRGGRKSEEGEKETKRTSVTTDENRTVPFVRSLSIASSAGEKKKEKKKRKNGRTNVYQRHEPDRFVSPPRVFETSILAAVQSAPKRERDNQSSRGNAVCL